MECFYCRGQLAHGTAPFDVTRHGYHVHFDAVPAWVCSQCGEALFDGEAVALIEQARDSLDEQVEKMRVVAA
jgi:YgiT-type zinc finger domain-containing protein